MIDRAYRCEECDKSFQTRNALDMHNHDKHNIKIPREVDDGYMTEADYQTWGNL